MSNATTHLVVSEKDWEGKALKGMCIHLTKYGGYAKEKLPRLHQQSTSVWGIPESTYDPMLNRVQFSDPQNLNRV